MSKLNKQMIYDQYKTFKLYTYNKCTITTVITRWKNGPLVLIPGVLYSNVLFAKLTVIDNWCSYDQTAALLVSTLLLGCISYL